MEPRTLVHNPRSEAVFWVWYIFPAMDPTEALSRDLVGMVVPQVGRLAETSDVWAPYRLVDGNGAEVEAVSEYFRDLQAAGRSVSTLRSYGMDLLRWFRFLWANDIPWNRATRIEARDFCRWMLVAGKPRRPHWRHQRELAEQRSTMEAYAPSVRAHCETVLRCFCRSSGSSVADGRRRDLGQQRVPVAGLLVEGP